MGNTTSSDTVQQREKRSKSRINSIDSITSVNHLLVCLKPKKSNSSFKTRSSEDSNKSFNTACSQVTQIPKSTTTVKSKEEEKIVYSSELVLKELYLSPETSPERRRDNDRRHRQHYLFKRIWSGNRKIPLNNPSLIIHWCCATAVWDIELAFEFPHTRIVGIDYETLAVSSLTHTVKNFSFINASIHNGDTGLQQFQENTVDYIMMRDVWLFNTPDRKWKTLLKEMYRILKPGGYIEIYEQSSIFNCMGPQLTQLEKWAHNFYKAIQYDPQTLFELHTYLDEAGFHQITRKSLELPVGEWSETQSLKETGYLQKDLIERRYREVKRWLCSCNHVSENEFLHFLIEAMDECEEHKTSIQQLYYCAQKPPINVEA